MLGQVLSTLLHQSRGGAMRAVRHRRSSGALSAHPTRPRVEVVLRAGGAVGFAFEDQMNNEKTPPRRPDVIVIQGPDGERIVIPVPPLPAEREEFDHFPPDDELT